MSAIEELAAKQEFGEWKPVPGWATTLAERFSKGKVEIWVWPNPLQGKPYRRMAFMVERVHADVRPFLKGGEAFPDARRSFLFSCPRDASLDPLDPFDNYFLHSEDWRYGYAYHGCGFSDLEVAAIIGAKAEAEANKFSAVNAVCRSVQASYAGRPVR